MSLAAKESLLPFLDAHADAVLARQVTLLQALIGCRTVSAPTATAAFTREAEQAITLVESALAHFGVQLRSLANRRWIPNAFRQPRQRGERPGSRFQRAPRHRAHRGPGQVDPRSVGRRAKPGRASMAAARHCRHGRKKCRIRVTACCDDTECGAVPCHSHTCDCTGQNDGTSCGVGKQYSGGDLRPGVRRLWGFVQCRRGLLQCVVRVGARARRRAPAPPLGRSAMTAATAARVLSCVGFFCQ